MLKATANCRVSSLKRGHYQFVKSFWFILFLLAAAVQKRRGST